MDVLAFLDVEVRDPPEGSRADVDVGLWLDLPGAAHHGCDLTALDRACQDFGIASLRPLHRKQNNRCQKEDDTSDGSHALPCHGSAPQPFAAVRFSPASAWKIAAIIPWVASK